MEVNDLLQFFGSDLARIHQAHQNFLGMVSLNDSTLGEDQCYVIGDNDTPEAAKHPEVDYWVTKRFNLISDCWEALKDDLLGLRYVTTPRVEYYEKRSHANAGGIVFTYKAADRIVETQPVEAAPADWSQMPDTIPRTLDWSWFVEDHDSPLNKAYRFKLTNDLFDDNDLGLYRMSAAIHRGLNKTVHLCFHGLGSTESGYSSENGATLCGQDFVMSDTDGMHEGYSSYVYANDVDHSRIRRGLTPKNLPLVEFDKELRICNKCRARYEEIVRQKKEQNERADPDC